MVTLTRKKVEQEYINDIAWPFLPQEEKIEGENETDEDLIDTNLKLFENCAPRIDQAQSCEIVTLYTAGV